LFFEGSRRGEQLGLRSQQCIMATVEDSVLRTEMTGLESQEEDDPKRILFFKSMSWLGQGRLGLIVEMKTGLLVSGRHSLTRPWVSRSRLLLRSRSRLVVAKSSN
jgi:hypothetical protein